MKKPPDRPTFSILSEDHIRRIHENTLVILEQTGVRVLHDGARKILLAAGARREGDSIVRIPHPIVEKAIQSSPKRVEIYNREGALWMVLDGTRTYYGAVSDSFSILDHKLGRPRPFLLADIERVVKVIDAMPNIHFMTCPSLLPKENAEQAARLTFRECFKSTHKPFGFHGDLNTCRDIIQFCLRFSGATENVLAKPFILKAVEPISPLQHTEEGTAKLLLCAEYRVPLIYFPYCLMGGTSPVTIAGSLVQCNAEVLSGLVVHQLHSPGAPFIYGAMPSPMDMRTTTGPYGAPELHLAIAASRQIARHYGIPFFGTAGPTDSKHLDSQAVMEATMSCLLTGFSGPDLAHDVGLLDHSNMVSSEMIILTDELIDMTRALVLGIELNDKVPAPDMIQKIGWKVRSSIDEGGTYGHQKEARPSDHLGRSTACQEPEMRMRVRNRLEEILRHRRLEPLPKDVAQDLERLATAVGRPRG